MITDEYKNKLLQNLTKMKIVPIYDFADFTDVVSYEKEDIINELDTAFPYGYVQVGELQCKNSDNEQNGFSIVYGYYYTESGQTGYAYRKGYIILFDDNMNKVALLTQYDSGTDFSPFVLLNVDEKGQIYGVDYSLRDGNYKNRFIMLNNISVKQPTQEYKAVLRQSYFIQCSDDSSFENLHMLNYICKDPNSSHYAMGRTVYGVLELKINVGSENEWTYYRDTPSTFPSVVLPVTHPLILWNEDGIMSFTAYYLGDSNNTGNWGIYKATNNGTTINTSAELFNIDTTYNSSHVEEFIPNVSSTAFTSYRAFNVYTTSPDSAYIMIGGTYYLDTQLKARYDTWLIRNENIYIKYEDWELDAYQRDINMFCDLELLNGNMFIKYYWQPQAGGDNNNYLVNIFVLPTEEPVDDKKIIAEVEPSEISKFHVFGIKNAFELYTIYWLGRDFDSSLMMLSKTNLIYGQSHYNGVPGMSGFSLVPRQIRLYDNEGIIFARTLYNMTINKNILECTLQVPNTMLNDTTITETQLMGWDMTEISVNSEEITKNIYETLYVNIFNKVNMVNKNDPDNPISNPTGASRLIYSVSTRFEPNADPYDNSKINKIRINYKNGDSYTKNIISCNITNNISDIQFQITPISDILNIEIISNDEKTVYQRIVEVDNYEIGKTYKISQKCHVE